MAIKGFGDGQRRMRMRRHLLQWRSPALATVWWIRQLVFDPTLRVVAQEATSSAAPPLPPTTPTMLQDHMMPMADCAQLNNTQAPQVPTLRASPVNQNVSFVVRPDCSMDFVKMELVDGASWLHAGLFGIVDVESFSPVEHIDLSSNSIKSHDFSADTTLRHIVLATNFVTSISAFKYPPNLLELDFEGNQLSEFNASLVPDTLGFLYLGKNGLNSLENFDFPKSLRLLDLYANNLSSVATFVCPPRLKSLYLHDNRFEVFEDFVFPLTLEELKLGDNPLRIVRGVVFPSSLTSLDLSNTQIEEFEIRQSDVSTLKNAQVTSPTQSSPTKCSDRTATRTQVNDRVFCIISDEAFRAKYAAVINNRSFDGESSRFSNAKSSSSASVWIIISVVLCAVAIGAVGFGCWRKRTNNNQVSKNHGTSEVFVNLERESDEDDDTIQLKDDIRNDNKLLVFRVPGNEIKWVRQLAVGGCGIVYLATYQGENVAVKQILPERAKERRALISFMDEIRLYSTLSHPKIVRFLGVSWSTLLDLLFLLEYMPNGDLHNLLECMHGSDKRCFDWFASDATVAPSKCHIALDIAEALTYLHGFEKPILHRDLKSRNVLFSGTWDAKISDFGVSREKSCAFEETKTMTAEVGTVAWTAPEVLQGERYNEKSDVYSFGVIMSELDTCKPPYQMKTEALTDGHVTGTRIAMMVSVGKLKPTISETCPVGIRSLALACLSFHPSERPTAQEVLRALESICVVEQMAEV